MQKQAKNKFKFSKKGGHPRKMITFISKILCFLLCIGFDCADHIVSNGHFPILMH